METEAIISVIASFVSIIAAVKTSSYLIEVKKIKNEIKAGDDSINTIGDNNRIKK